MEPNERSCVYLARELLRKMTPECERVDESNDDRDDDPELNRT